MFAITYMNTNCIHPPPAHAAPLFVLSSRLILFCFLSGNLWAENSAQTFRNTYERQLADPTRLSQEEKEAARQFNYVFIGGFLGEALSKIGYFTEGFRELKEMGIPTRQLHSLYPPSGHSIEHNSDHFLPQAISEIQEKSDKPFVFIAHSKGVGEVVAFAIKNPHFIDSNVKLMVLLSGAAHGSAVADYLTSNATVSSNLSPFVCLGMQCLRTAAHLLRPWIEEGLQSLTTEKSADFFSRIIRENPDSIPKIENKLLYVQTWETPSRSSPILQLTSNYLKQVSGDSVDGLVTHTKQRISGVGTQSVTLKHTDHALPCNRLLSWISVKKPRAFTRAVVVTAIGKVPSYFQ